jgi:hypothetical protein
LSSAKLSSDWRNGEGNGYCLNKSERRILQVDKVQERERERKRKRKRERERERERKRERERERERKRERERERGRDKHVRSVAGIHLNIPEADAF